MKKILQDNNGQALLLVVIVLFIVFFLVVSLSNNVSIDTVNTVQNQDSQKAFSAASAGLLHARKDIQNATNAGGTLPNTSVQFPFGSGADTYLVNYVIQPETIVTQTINPDTTLQVSAAGATSVSISSTDNQSLLFVNIIKNTGNYFCIFYPSTITLDPKNQADVSTFIQGPGCPGMVLNGTGPFTTTIALPLGTQFVRVTLANYVNHTSTLIINPGTATVQEYQIIATGFFNGSRRILHGYYFPFGSVPTLFDYVVFNGGKNSNISF